MDIDVQNKFITAFYERMNFFIPRFEELFEKKSLLKIGQRSQIYLYWHKVNNIYYAVKEINIKCIKDLESIKRMIDCFFLVDKQICNKKSIVRSEGFYYKFNRSKGNINSHITSPSNSTIDFYFVQEKCDGSLDDLFNILLTSSNKNNNINYIDTQNTGINQSTSTDQKPPQIVSLAVPQRPNSSHSQNHVIAKKQCYSSSQPDIPQDNQEIQNSQQRVAFNLKNEEIQNKFKELDIFNLYNNLKDIILQIHELDGCAIYIESFDLNDIMFTYTNNQIEFKFSKITDIACDSKEQMKLLAKSILSIGLLKKFNNQPEFEQLSYHQLNQLSQDKKHSQYNYQQQEQDQLQIKFDKNQIDNNKQSSYQSEYQYQCQNQQNQKHINQQQQQSQNQQFSINVNNNSNTNKNHNQTNVFSNNQNNLTNKDCGMVKQASNKMLNSNAYCSSQQLQHLPITQTTHQNNLQIPNQKFYHHNTSVSLNNSPSSSVSKFQKQPALSNNTSFKDFEQKLLNSNNLAQYQCRSCQSTQFLSTNALTNNGSQKLNQGQNSLTNIINQDHYYNENDIVLQKQQTQLLLENIKLFQKKYEQADIASTMTKFCKLLENMVKGQTVNQCYYQILKIYNSSESFYEFNQSKLSFINPQVLSQSKRQLSNAQLLFSPPRNVLRKSDSNYRARSQNNDDVTISSSPRQSRKRSSRGQTQDNSLKDNTLFTLVQAFNNLINAIKLKKKKLRFEKYLTQYFINSILQIPQISINLIYNNNLQLNKNINGTSFYKYNSVKEMRFLKTIDPNFCQVNCISVDFGNINYINLIIIISFYQAEAMQLTGDSFETLINLQGLELNFDFWNEVNESQFIYMIKKLSKLVNLRLLTASLQQQ